MSLWSMSSLMAHLWEQLLQFVTLKNSYNMIQFLQLVHCMQLSIKVCLCSMHQSNFLPWTMTWAKLEWLAPHPKIYILLEVDTKSSQDVLKIYFAKNQKLRESLFFIYIPEISEKVWSSSWRHMSLQKWAQSTDNLRAICITVFLRQKKETVHVFDGTNLSTFALERDRIKSAAFSHQYPTLQTLSRETSTWWWQCFQRN